MHNKNLKIYKYIEISDWFNIYLNLNKCLYENFFDNFFVCWKLINPLLSYNLLKKNIKKIFDKCFKYL